MASFRKRGKHWEARIRYQDPATGKHKEKTLSGFRTKKEAEIAAAKIESQMKDGRLPSEWLTGDLTFQDVFHQWWNVHSKTIKGSSEYTTFSKFKKYFFPAFGHLPIKEITKGYCQQVINDLSEKIKSVEDYKIHVNQVFQYAVRMGYITENPMDAVVVPKRKEDFLAVEEKGENFWTREEANVFLRLAKEHMNPQDYVLFYLLIYTGMRKGELLALEWENVNFEEGTIFVRQTLFFRQKKEIFQKVKTYESRIIHLDPQTLSLLKKWRVQQREYLLRFGNTEQPRFVITRPDGRPLRLAHPNNVLSSFIRKHGLRPITVHGLRHTHASLLFEAGASIKEVQDRLGHRSVQTTMNIYTHVTKHAKTRAAEMFAKYMNTEA